MKNWIKLNPRRLNEGRTANLGGVDVEVFLSPYDVPDAVRGEINKTSGHFEIEFRYMGSDEPLEPVERQKADRYVSFQVGKRSKRLYGMDINVESLGVDRVQLEMKIPETVNHAIDSFTQGLPSTAFARRNYSITKRALDSEKGRLFEAFSQ